jgi:hypothetical protein
MKNNIDLIALQNKLFEAMEWIQDRELEGEKLQEEVNRQMAFNELAKSAIANGALIAKVASMSEEAGDIPDDLPLIPLVKTKEPVITGKNRKLIDFSKDKVASNI